ncbi:DUF2892 domain-containing protein [Brevibacillus ruminantium]|uniref:DUF2892 domain-containing protein n=1 Tax=Brevibacillus ruminantium TaxID=2950604 RepID=A0ABY4WCN6_9BACL|nr:DUF2892 domain-containing protein [Brevibacillus ruminantium]USG64818.1 DUF2892 domain-containing protein [Brevibacillus ruminantium]
MRNLGRLDRVTRVVSGTAFLSMFWLATGPWKYAGLLGVVLLLTGLAGTCLFYKILGVNTCRK